MAKDKKIDVWQHNFAEDQGLAESVASHFSTRVRTVRSNRIDLEESWWRHFNQWNVTKDGYHPYVGRAQLFIPEVRKNVEAQARQLTKSAFPGDDCFDVSPGQTGTRRGALAWKSYHQWAMDNCKLTSKYFVAMRQLCMLGTSPVYLPWRKEVRSEFRSRKTKGARKITPKRQEVELFNGPDFIVRDLFRWYPFNPKKADLEDGCFEIMPASRFELQRMQREGMLANYERITAGPSNAYINEEFARDVLRAESIGIQIQYNMAYAGQATFKSRTGDDDDLDGTADTTFMRTRIFADMVFPQGCEEGEDPEKPIPMEIDIYGNDICGRIQRNQFYHQKPPYVVGRYIQPNADEFYGQGIPWAIQYMQYEINAKAEQGMDSTTLTLNPIAIIDPGLAGASNEFTIEPGATWFANPAGVKFSNMTDVSPVANASIMQLKSLMADYSDRSPALPPQLLGKSRTATQSEMVFDSLGVDNWLFQMQNENLILTPMLQQWEAITDQNMDDDMLITILGRQSGDLKRTLLSREDLLGRYAYRWKGGSVAAGKQITARQMLDALKVITQLQTASPGSLPKFSGTEFLQVLWSDLWGLKNFERVFGLPETLVSQDVAAENKMVKMGLEIEVLPNDDDVAHMNGHDQALQDEKNPQVRMLLMAHNLVHKKQYEDKQQALQAQAQAMQVSQQNQQMQQRLQAAQLAKITSQANKDNAIAKKDGGGGSALPGSQPTGNRTQLSPNTSTGDLGSGMRA